MAGLVSALALVGASTLVDTDGAQAGQAALRRAVGEVSNDVTLRYWWATSGRWPASMVASAPSYDTLLPNLGDALPVRPVARAKPAFDALIAEAESALRRGDANTAQGLVDEALAKDVEAPRRGQALLMGLRLAARATDQPLVQSLWTQAQAELTGVESQQDGTSLLLLCFLVAQPLLGETAADEAEALVGRWFLGGLALPGETPRLVAGQSGPRLVENPTRVALRRRLADEAQGEQLRGRALLLAATNARKQGLPTPVGTGVLLAVPGGWLRWRTSGGFGKNAEARLVGPADLGHAVRDYLDGNGVVPEGFVVVLDGAPPKTVDGTAVHVGEAFGDLATEPRTILLEHPDEALNGGFGFTVFHMDPDGFMAAELRLRHVVRGALWLAAAFAIVASLATFRALRREARLARLKSEFVAGVSHELRTPVASIQLLAENLEQGRVPVDGQARYHGLIRREARRLGRLVNDVLDFARLDRGEGPRLQAEPLDGAAWAEELTDDALALATRLGSELEVRVGDVPTEPTLDGDALRRAALNLIDNASRHGRPAGDGPAPLLLEVELTGGALIVRVSDRGAGIPKGRRAAVLRPFVTGGAGSGLGLSLVAAIAEGHGGTLRLADRDDGQSGLVAELSVPVSEAPLLIGEQV